MTLNIGGGFSLARAASTTVPSFFSPLPPLMRPGPPENLTNRALAQFLRSWYAMEGGGAMRQPAPSRMDYLPFHGLACEQQPGRRALTTLGAARKRRAVFGFAGCLFRHSGAGAWSSKHGPG